MFSASNPLLKDLLADRPQAKTLLVIDGSMASAQPGLTAQIEAYFAAWPQSLQLVCPPLILPGGEQAKNSWTEVSQIHAQIEHHHLDRHSYVIAVGGGALLDVAGFAAATAHRGIRHVRIPSTTLSQNDSGVGVKNGINAFGKKNFLGAFAPPFAVVNDFQLLASLPERDRRAGCAEAVKVALIRDSQFFCQLERDAPRLRCSTPEAAQAMIRRCAQLHIDHIAGGGDPFELGPGRPLDFGHWSAHKLEALSSYRLRHGEAVAIGIAIDTLYSRNIGWLDEASAERALALLESLGFELFAPELRQRNAYRRAGGFARVAGVSRALGRGAHTYPFARHRQGR